MGCDQLGLFSIHERNEGRRAATLEDRTKGCDEMVGRVNRVAQPVDPLRGTSSSEFICAFSFALFIKFSQVFWSWSSQIRFGQARTLPPDIVYHSPLRKWHPHVRKLRWLLMLQRYGWRG